MLPATTRRVSNQTSEAINRRIRRETRGRLAHYAAHREAIPGRLYELEREWDIERALEANASVIALAGTALGAADRRWLALPALVATFLLQHALHGWCPPLPVLRRMGFRTAAEIARERYALKALSGDFRNPSSEDTSARQAGAALRSAERR